MNRAGTYFPAGRSWLSLPGHRHLFHILRTLPFFPRAEERDAAGEERADKEDERDAAVDQSRAARPREDSHEDQQEEEY